MIKVKKKFFDRFDQSVKIFRKNFIIFVLPFFLFNLFFYIFYEFFSIFILNKIKNLGFDFNNKFDLLSILYDKDILLLIFIGLCIFIIYLFINIFIYLISIKAIKDVLNGKKINLKENISYGYLRFFSFIKLYVYIFNYVYLYPLIIFIFGLLFILFGKIYGNYIFYIIGFIILLIGFFSFIYFGIYRGFKSKLGIFKCIDNDSFDNETFKKSLIISNKKFKILIGNIFLIGLLVNVLINIIKSTIGMLFFTTSGGFSNLISGISNSFRTNDLDNIKNIINNYISNQSIIYNYIRGFLNLTLESIGMVFILLFLYILYIRFQKEFDYENGNYIIDNDSNIDNKNIDIENKNQINEKNISNIVENNNKITL